MKPDFKIELATIEDAEDLRRFFHSNLLASFSFFPVEAQNFYLEPWGSERLKKRISEKREMFYLAHRDRSLVGIVAGTPAEGGVATIIWLLTSPDAQGKGIGTKLFEKACHHYRESGCHKIKLTAPSETAKDFYLYLGMKQEGFHPNHWWNCDFYSLGFELSQPVSTSN